MKSQMSVETKNRSVYWISIVSMSCSVGFGLFKFT